MRYYFRSTLIAASFLTTHAYALPRPATYSVVNVDGGQTQTALPTTVVHTVTDSTNSETTISVTIHESPATATIVSIPSTIVQTVAHATDTALVPEVSTLPHHPEAGPQESSSSSIPVVTPATVPNPVATVPHPETVTIVSLTTATPTTSYYDNGMWHTSYAIKQWPEWSNYEWLGAADGVLQQWWVELYDNQMSIMRWGDDDLALWGIREKLKDEATESGRTRSYDVMLATGFMGGKPASAAYGWILGWWNGIICIH
ncbi:uncharacterized protein LTR77_005424 [Saxophila tyrrhenica]|uniref:Uncharacterized protein n=1 Tax=Saxophila tyrrhenica TaxID=1690608 RepID=A0AAV9P8J1_9PEZI|nr:hypothetical protein LTR77_005424 [Saxophila tyrrhenica]